MSVKHDIISLSVVEMAKKTEDEIRAALDIYWPSWTEEDLKTRCRIVKFPGSDVETLYMDYVPLLEIYPVESSTEMLDNGSIVIRHTRQFRQLR